MKKRFKYFPVVISAPSGGGKSTIKNSLLEKDSRFAFSVTCTTRPKRSNERHGKDYYFVTTEKFKEMLEKNLLIEWATVHGHNYGTPKKSVLTLLEKGKIPLMTIDVKGAESVKKIFKDAVSVFLLPPSLKIMLKRLYKRGEKKDGIDVRMATAKKEILSASHYDYLVINDNLKTAANDIVTLVNAESGKMERNKNFVEDFKKQLFSLKA